jgi:hypothetical protein
MNLGIGTLLLFVFAVIGMTHIIVDPAKIAKWFRDVVEDKGPMWLNELLGCYQCTGFWVGIIAGLILISLNPLIVFLCGCAGSFIGTWGATYLNYLEAKSIINLDDE